MAKQSGLGDNLYIGGYDLSGDVQALSKLSGSIATLDVTSINDLAFERIGGKRDGSLAMTVYFDKAAGMAHPVLSALPTADTLITYCRGTALGGSVACMNSKLIDYAPTRGTDGSLIITVNADANEWGLEWGLGLTAGKRTDTAATNGASVNNGSSTAFGAQAYLQVFAFTGTDATVVLQDSADGTTFANIASGSFAQVTSSTPQTQRIALSNAATVRQYVRAITTTSGGFTSLTFAVMFNRNAIAGQVF